MRDLFYIAIPILALFATCMTVCFMSGRIDESERHKQEVAKYQRHYELLADETDYVTFLAAEAKFQGDGK